MDDPVVKLDTYFVDNVAETEPSALKSLLSWNKHIKRWKDLCDIDSHVLEADSLAPYKKS